MVLLKQAHSHFKATVSRVKLRDSKSRDNERLLLGYLCSSLIPER